MSTESILSFKRRLFLAACLVAGLLWGADSDYIALFSAEQEHYRRVLIDGVGDRRVEVDLDDTGQMEIKIWGVGEQDYVGRRAYHSGYFIPVTIRVDFPSKSIMSIRLSGVRFKDYVRYKVIDSDIYIVDLYTQALPRESYFREETISALWPAGRFQPDIFPAAQISESGLVEDLRLPVASLTLPGAMIPFRRILLRAVVWAGCVSGFMLITGLVLIWFQRRRKLTALESASNGQTPAAVNQPTISDARVRAFMALDGSLSYDEATLINALGGPKSSTRPRR